MPRAYLWPINMLCFLTLILMMLLQQTKTDKSPVLDLQHIPYVLGDFYAYDVPLVVDEINVYRHFKVLKRRYHLPGRSWSIGVFMSLSGPEHHAQHPPEYCYLAQGWAIRENTLLSGVLAQDASVHYLYAEKQEIARERAWYWFTDGEQIQAQYFSRLLLEMKARLLGKERPWLMVWLSVPILSTAAEQQEQQLAVQRLARLLNARLVRHAIEP